MQRVGPKGRVRGQMVLIRRVFSYIAVAALAASPLLPATPASAAVARATCKNAPEGAQDIRETPWHEDWLAPQRVWPFTTGRGVTSAVPFPPSTLARGAWVRCTRNRSPSATCGWTSR